MRTVISPVTLLRGQAAFSLVEIILAIGIISFALVAILGLFPVALNSATDSQRETQAALIARSIFNDLSSETGKIRHLQGYDTNAGGSAPRNLPAFPLKVDLTAASPASYLAYDSDGLLQKKSTASEYNSGVHDAGYLAKVTVYPPVQVAPYTPDDILSQIKVTVSVPPQVGESARKSYDFVSLLNQQ